MLCTATNNKFLIPLCDTELPTCVYTEQIVSYASPVR